VGGGGRRHVEFRTFGSGGILHIGTCADHIVNVTALESNMLRVIRSFQFTWVRCYKL
jgi:hypothetical protein